MLGPGMAAAAAAAPATGGASVPFSIILPILASLVSGAFGKSEEEKKAEDVAKMEKYLGNFYMPSKANVSGMNNILTQAIMNNMGRYSDWGWQGSDSGDLRGLIQQYLSTGAAGAGVVNRTSGTGLRAQLV
jgi:hypothetical protein